MPEQDGRRRTDQSTTCRLHINRVIAAEMDIIVQSGGVGLGTSHGSIATRAMADDLCARLYANAGLQAEIVATFVEGDFDRHDLARFMNPAPATVARLWPGLISGGNAMDWKKQIAKNELVRFGGTIDANNIDRFIETLEQHYEAERQIEYLDRMDALKVLGDDDFLFDGSENPR